MKLRLSILMAVVAAVLVATLPAQAADGQTRDVTFNFKTAGDKLTGTMSGRQGDVEISDGKVKGDEVSFDVTMTVQGNAMKMTYKGKVAGDEIKFTRHRDGSDRTSEFTAQRAK